MRRPNSFPLEKVLTLSATDWALMTGKDLRDFQPKGVHTFSTGPSSAMMTPLDGFILGVPSDAVVVVGYREAIACKPDYSGKRLGYINIYSAYGTALIPKKKNDRKSK